ncbi:hypothetical protein Tco_0052023 [Tanacetum coccineum]
MSGTVPHILPPPGTNLGNAGSPNRVDIIPIDNTTTNNVAQNVVNEDLPQLLYSRGGSHVTNVSTFDVEDFSSWKDWFLVYLDGLEPYLIENLENGPFVDISPLSTSTNPLTKPQKQWSPEDKRLTNHYKRLKRIIISCLSNDVMKSVIKCTTAKSMWNDLILAHEGPSDTRDTKIAVLRLKFNAFKALKGEKRANNSIKNDSLATLYGIYNYEEGLMDQIYESKTSRFTIQVSRSKALISNTHLQDSDSDVEEDTRSSSEFLADLNVEVKVKKRLFTESFNLDEDEGVTRVKAFMAIVEDEPSVGKADARSGQWVEITMKKTAPEITSDFESECDNQDPLPPLPKLSRLEPIVKISKKKTQTKSLSVLDPCPDRKADSSTK